MGHGQPSTIGPYTIVEELGRGGMGVVYRARRADIGREVALKLIRPQDDADPDSIARFQREARAAAGLAGTPGIVGVLDAGEDDGRLYIAMDFIAGRSLESLIDDADLAPARAAELVKQAAEAVHAAHQHGTLHRDLKPANILVDERDRAWVTDFGLALTREADEASARLTKSGWLVGTPSYMPPEQARAEGLDGRADVYALGATLYECLVGQTPHAGTSMYEVLEQVLREEPPPPSRRNPEVPRDLETIVLKALEKDREQRYPTAQALADDLGRWLAGEAIVASPPGPLERLRRGVRRRKALTAAVVATVATGIVVAAITIPGWIAEQRARAKEQADAAAALRDAERRKQAELTALAELSGLWAKLVLAKEGFHNAARDPAKVRASIAALRDEVSGFIENHPGAPQGPYVRARAHLYLDALPEAEADLRASIALAPEFAPGHALLAQVLIHKYRRALYAVGSARSVLAHRLAVQPIMEEAKAELQAAADVPGGRAGVAAWRLLRTREDDIGEVVARALSRHYLEGDRQGAIDLLQEAHRADQAAAYAGWIGSWAIDPELAEKWATEALRLRPHWGRVHLDRGTARMKRRNVHGAIEDFTRALELGGVDEMALSNRAVAHYQAGRLREAIDDATRAIAIDEANSAAWNNRALAKADLGDTKGALQDYGRAIALAKDDAEVWYHRGVTLARYGDRLRAAGRRAEWAEAYRRARADYDQAIALEPNYAKAFFERGVLSHQEGKVDAAIEDYTRAIACDAKYGNAYANRALARVHQRNYEAAIDDLTTAVTVEPTNAMAWYNRGNIRNALGDKQGAYADFTKAMACPNPPPEPFNDRAVMRKDAGDLDGALADFAACLKVDPKYFGAYANRASVRHAKGDVAGAIADLDAAERLMPKGHPVLAVLRKQRARYRAELGK